MSVLVSVSLLACGAARPPALSSNADLVALQRVVGWDGTPLEPVVLLLSEYLRAERFDEGHRYFAERAARSPDVPIFAAAEALFAVQLADRVPLLRRKRYVDEALAALDRAADRDPGASRLLRAMVSAQVPALFGRAESAAAELEAMTTEGSGLPAGSLRPAAFALAHAYDTLGRDTDVARALRLAGRTSLDTIEPDNGNDFTIGAGTGVRFTGRAFVEEQPGVFAAYGYGFAEMYFVVGDDGVVAIDAGSTPEAARAAKAELRTHTSLPITWLVLTHTHWDHIGGVAGMVEDGTRVVASADYRAGLDAMNAVQIDEIGLFLGPGLPDRYTVTPDLLISEPTPLALGGRELVVLPTTGGETGDALLVSLPAEKTVFSGDVLFLSLGVPFVEEGSPEGLIDVLGQLRTLGAERVLQGHRPMTDVEGPAVYEGLGLALDALRTQVLRDLHDSRTVAESVAAGFVPDVLQQHPEAALTYLLARENFVRRMYDQRTGYWHADGEQMELHTSAELARAIDLVGGGRPRAFRDAVERLLDGGDYPLAITLAEYGVQIHPDDAGLLELRRRALVKVTDEYQVWDVNKYPLYAGRLGLELPAR